MNLSVDPSLLAHLLGGDLAIDGDGTTFHRPDGSTWPMRSEVFTAGDGDLAIRAVECRHLFPIESSLPICATCGGKPVKEVTPEGLIDSCCDACKDGLPLHVTLTVATGAGWCEPSKRIIPTQRPVARVHVIQALPIYPAELEDGLPIAWQSHVAPKFDSPQDPQPLLLWHGQDGDHDSWKITDISHLRDMASWVPGEWALLVDRVEGL